MSTANPICKAPKHIKIGVITDLHYGSGIREWNSRFYSLALKKVNEACSTWSEEHCSLILNLGDSIDRKCVNSDQDPVQQLKDIVDAFSRSNIPAVHVIGNHDLSTVPRKELRSVLGWELRVAASEVEVEEVDACYCCVSLSNTWSVIVLDTYDIAVSALAYPIDHPKHIKAVELLREGQKTREGCFMEHAELNGAVGDRQLLWLRRTLEYLASHDKMALIVSHAGFLPQITMYNDAFCWNWQEVLNTIKEQELALHKFVIAAFIVGHDHFGSCGQDYLTKKTHVVVEAASMLYRFISILICTVIEQQSSFGIAELGVLHELSSEISQQRPVCESCHQNIAPSSVRLIGKGQVSSRIIL